VLTLLPTQKFDSGVTHVSTEIASPAQPLAGRWMDYEAGASLCRMLPIATRQGQPTDIKMPGNPVGFIVKPLVEDVPNLIPKA
jgi:hypothetical protein